jgi:hypothetical protein
MAESGWLLIRRRPEKQPGEGGPDLNRSDLNRPDLKECFLT